MRERLEMNNGVLHILNGQSMYNYYKKTSFLKQEKMIPFNEAMCYGRVSSDLFSDEFVAIRANVHHVTEEEYKEITLKPLQPLIKGDFTQIELWFDADMFCQLNILTILAWLDQINYKNPIKLHIVGEEFAVLESFTLTAKGFNVLYQQVLIDKIMPTNIGPAPLKKGVALYLTYLNKDSELMMYIEKHKNVAETELMYKLLNEFTEYGLGDIQYMDLIKNSRRHL